MHVLQFDEVSEFASRASDLLLRDEARHNLALGLLGTLEEHPWRYPERRFWLVEERGTVVGGALRTPPHGVVLAQPLAAGAIDALATGIDEELPGAVGATPEIESFAVAWSRRHGVPWRTRFRQRIFELEEVIPPGPCPGTARVAGSNDRTLLVEWLRAFSIEAVGEEHPEDAALEANVDHKLLAADATYVLWEVEGEPVSCAAFGSSTPSGTRIGPVYTPPEHRGHGYASAVTAHVSTDRLAAGRRFCFLHTNLANPTANKIYAQIGYRPVCDALQVEFGQPVL
ncbi:MAG TPA: GNAT family N-acetyltransferase [Gaiellaceae bacterium]|nr:GNAT family N-acetyltransferase [Gaiellaceae bacterium]